MADVRSGGSTGSRDRPPVKKKDTGKGKGKKRRGPREVAVPSSPRSGGDIDSDKDVFHDPEAELPDEDNSSKNKDKGKERETPRKAVVPDEDMARKEHHKASVPSRPASGDDVTAKRKRSESPPSEFEYDDKLADKLARIQRDGHMEVGDSRVTLDDARKIRRDRAYRHTRDDGIVVNEKNENLYKNEEPFGPNFVMQELVELAVLEQDPHYKLLVLIAGACNEDITQLYDNQSMDNVARYVQDVNDRRRQQIQHLQISIKGKREEIELMRKEHAESGARLNDLNRDRDRLFGMHLNYAPLFTIPDIPEVGNYLLVRLVYLQRTFLQRLFSIEGPSDHSILVHHIKECFDVPVANGVWTEPKDGILARIRKKLMTSITDSKRPPDYDLASPTQTARRCVARLLEFYIYLRDEIHQADVEWDVNFHRKVMFKEKPDMRRVLIHDIIASLKPENVATFVPYAISVGNIYTAIRRYADMYNNNRKMHGLVDANPSLETLADKMYDFLTRPHSTETPAIPNDIGLSYINVSGTTQNIITAHEFAVIELMYANTVNAIYAGPKDLASVLLPLTTTSRRLIAHAVAVAEDLANADPVLKFIYSHAAANWLYYARYMGVTIICLDEQSAKVQKQLERIQNTLLDAEEDYRRAITGNLENDEVKKMRTDARLLHEPNPIYAMQPRFTGTLHLLPNVVSALAMAISEINAKLPALRGLTLEEVVKSSMDTGFPGEFAQLVATVRTGFFLNNSTKYRKDIEHKSHVFSRIEAVRRLSKYRRDPTTGAITVVFPGQAQPYRQYYPPSPTTIQSFRLG